MTRERVGIIEFIPKDAFDAAFLDSKEGEWTNQGYGTVEPKSG